MDALQTYAATASVIAALMVFSTLVLFGVWVVRRLGLPQDLPPELHFEPAPPPMRAHADRAEAALIAARQARLRTIHERAFAAVRCAETCRELAVAAAAIAPTLAERLSALTTRAVAAAEAADRARADQPDAADAATTRHLAEAQAALNEAEVLTGALPGPSSKRLWVLLALGALVLAWLVAIMVIRHGIGPHSVAG